MSASPRLAGVLLCLSSLAVACGDDTSTADGAAGTGGSGAGASSTGGAGGTAGAAGEGGSFVPEPGITAEYFIDYYDLALTETEAGLDRDFADGGAGPGLGADRFSARWTGVLTPAESGDYTIITDTDDGVRVWLDGALVIDDWSGHFVTRNTAVVPLEAGVPVDLRVDYFELDLAASARLSWSKDTIPEQVIPADVLTTAPPSGLPGPKPPYQNPVIPFDCPDPGVLATSDIDPPGFVAACTGGSFPIRASRSLVTWTDTGAAILPNGKPAWAANGFRNWAPEIHRVGAGYVAYFTTVDSNDALAIGAASAPSPTGPFTETAGPLVQHPLGVIDATFFEDTDQKRWLVYKIDGNSQGQPTPILARELAADGLSFASGSSAVELIRNDGGSWEGGVVEAPFVVRHEGMYYLFYSGNVYDHRYRTGVARASSILGPYEKHGAPLLANNERWVGPGHGSIVTIVGETSGSMLDYFVYHAWTNAGDGTQLGGDGRQVLVDRIVWGGDGWPAIHDGTPSRSPLPWPGTE